jgi:hypothetical protein
VLSLRRRVQEQEQALPPSFSTTRRLAEKHSLEEREAVFPLKDFCLGIFNILKCDQSSNSEL